MSSKYWARPHVGLRPFFLLVLLALHSVAPAMADCPTGTVLRTQDSLQGRVKVSPRRLAIDEGGMALSTAMSMPVVDADILISQEGVRPEDTLSLQRWQWRLQVPRPTTITVADLLVVYQVAGPDGQPGVFTSNLDNTSHVKVTAETRTITEERRKNYILFKGYINLQLDYAEATRSGGYSGTLTVDIDCP